MVDCATIKKLKTGDENKMLYHYEYAIWTIEKKTLRIAVGICNNTDMPIVYMKDLQTEDYNCYSFYSIIVLHFLLYKEKESRKTD